VSDSNSRERTRDAAAPGGNRLVRTDYCPQMVIVIMSLWSAIWARKPKNHGTVT
jgi:hypothetical protein